RFGDKRTLWVHHVNFRACFQRVIGPGGKDAAAVALDSNAQTPGAWHITDRVGAAVFLAINRRAQRNVLAGDVVVVILEFFREIGSILRGIIGQWANLGDLERIERGLFLFQWSSH